MGKRGENKTGGEYFSVFGGDEYKALLLHLKLELLNLDNDNILSNIWICIKIQTNIYLQIRQPRTSHHHIVFKSSRTKKFKKSLILIYNQRPQNKIPDGVLRFYKVCMTVLGIYKCIQKIFITDEAPKSF